MKAVYKFVAGSSRVTPAGVALAAVLAGAFHTELGPWTAPLYLGILLVTLVAGTAETPT